jgi:hypothetical protein
VLYIHKPCQSVFLNIQYPVLYKPFNCFSQSIIVRTPVVPTDAQIAASKRLVRRNRKILNTSIGMMNHILWYTSVMQCFLVQHQAPYLYSYVLILSSGLYKYKASDLK